MSTTTEMETASRKFGEDTDAMRSRVVQTLDSLSNQLTSLNRIRKDFNPILEEIEAITPSDTYEEFIVESTQKKKKLYNNLRRGVRDIDDAVGLLRGALMPNDTTDAD